MTRMAQAKARFGKKQNTTSATRKDMKKTQVTGYRRHSHPVIQPTNAIRTFQTRGGDLMVCYNCVFALLPHCTCCGSSDLVHFARDG
jgi:hypothetical protein